jgi:hypothetical protein
MKLTDLKKLAVRKHYRIHFKIRNGSECVINEDGVATIPGFRGVADFNLEDELEGASEFLLEPALVAQKNPPRPQRLKRDELVAMTGEAPAPVAAADHDDD